jgi:hypothetical protein
MAGLPIGSETAAIVREYWVSGNQQTIRVVADREAGRRMRQLAGK